MGAIQHIVTTAAALGITRFGPEHIDPSEGLAAAAVAVIMAYPKPNWKLESSFLASLQRQVKQHKPLTDKQLAGACNTALLINKRVLAAQKEQEQPVKQQAAQPQPKQEQPKGKGKAGQEWVKGYWRAKKISSPRAYWTGKAS